MEVISLNKKQIDELNKKQALEVINIKNNPIFIILERT